MATALANMKGPCSDRFATLRPDGHIEVSDGAGPAFFPKRPWISRVDSWRETIYTASQKHGIAPAIVAAFMQIESGGYPNAVSRSGALGLMQLMPSTFNSLMGRAAHVAVDKKEALKPEINVSLGAKLLASLMKRYQGNLVSTAAGYNAGSARCGSLSQCKTNPWNLRTECGYVESILQAYNGAVDNGYEWRGIPMSSPLPTQAPTVQAASPAQQPILQASIIPAPSSVVGRNILYGLVGATIGAIAATYQEMG